MQQEKICKHIFETQDSIKLMITKESICVHTRTQFKAFDEINNCHTGENKYFVRDIYFISGIIYDLFIYLFFLCISLLFHAFSLRQMPIECFYFYSCDNDIVESYSLKQ
jgi:hypothetical protein